MGLLDMIKRKGFNEKLEECRNDKLAVLIDVRTPEEYEEGHVPGSINIPLQQIEKTKDVVQSKCRSIYVYCRSGARSRQAAADLRQMGYANVVNLGGIIDYKGKVVR